jgi:hypothetical protein
VAEARRNSPVLPHFGSEQHERERMAVCKLEYRTMRRLVDSVRFQQI